MQRLFVYGTLAPGRANHNILENISGTWEVATLRGHLFQEGWGVSMGCPGIVPSEDGEKVEGYVFSSELLTEHWQMLDKFEGEGYKRTPVNVCINKNCSVKAYVYALNRTV